MSEPTSSAADSDTKPLILVTGGTGYVSLQAIKQGLESGYSIRTTCRSSSRGELISSSLLSSGVDQSLVSSLDIRIADFLSAQGWQEALQDVDVILHTATPFPLADRNVAPLSEEEMIAPSLEGTRRILDLLKHQQKSNKGGIPKKFIFLSSISCVYLGNGFQQGRIFDENDWTDLQGKKPVIPFVRAKTLTERLIWEFDQGQRKEVQEQEQEQRLKAKEIDNENANPSSNLIEISTILPTGILGTFIRYPNENNTGSIIKQMLEGALSALPDLSFGIIDVRDLVSLIFLIVQRPSPFSSSTDSNSNSNSKSTSNLNNSSGRYIATTGSTLTLSDISSILRSSLPSSQTTRIPTRVAPSFLIKTLAKLNPALKAIVPELGERKEFNGNKAREEFPTWKPRSSETAIVDCAKQLVENGAQV